MSEENEQGYEIKFDFSGVVAEMQNTQNTQNTYFKLQQFIFKNRVYAEIISNFMLTLDIRDQNLLLKNIAENTKLCMAMCKKYGFEPMKKEDE